MTSAPAEPADRLAALERLLVDIQFDHPAQRARRVDEFYTSSRSDDGDQLRRHIRQVCLHALERRTFWAHRPGAVNVARAIAYQHVAGLLICALDAEPST